MRKIVSCMHVSLDGFVGGPNGEMNWIHVDEEIFDYAGDQTDQADVALYGRVTYEMMEGYWPTAADQPGASRHDIKHSGWYKQVTKVVLSKTMKGVESKNTRIISENVIEEITRLKQETGKNILIFGSPSVVHTLLQENLIDEFWLFVNPVLLAKGIPLFKDVKSIVKLRLGTTKALTSGVVCLQYNKETD